MEHAKSKIISICFLFFMLSGCTDNRIVEIEIDNPKHREVYIDLLNKNALEYNIDENNTIIVKVKSQEYLHEKMKAFDDFVNEEIRKENELLNNLGSE